ncbi:MAG: DUF6338 family protein [Dehalococcoidia bacterium]
MNTDLNAFTIGLFILAVFPGLVSTAIYRLLMPARAVEWGNAVLQGLFYSTVNAALGLPVLLFLIVGYDPLTNPLRYSVAAIWLLLVAPILWTLLLIGVFRIPTVAQRIQIPYPTAWDAYFNRRQRGFILVHLSNGELLGGYWGPNSYAGAFPNDGDLYLEAVYQIDDAGKFADPIAYTRGVLLRKDAYSYLEFFAVPEPENPGHVQQAI